MAIVRTNAIVARTVAVLVVLAGLGVAGQAWAGEVDDGRGVPQQLTSTRLWPLPTNGTWVLSRTRNGLSDTLTLSVAGTQVVNGAATTLLQGSKPGSNPTTTIPADELNVTNDSTDGLRLHRAKLFGFQIGSATADVTVVLQPPIQIMTPTPTLGDSSTGSGVAMITMGATLSTAPFSYQSNVTAYGTVVGTPAALAQTVHTSTNLALLGQPPFNGTLGAEIDWGWDLGLMVKIVFGLGFGQQQETLKSTNVGPQTTALSSSNLPTVQATSMSAPVTGAISGGPVAATPVGGTVTAFGSIVNGGATDATSCGFAPLPVATGQTPWAFVYAETDPATNQVVGSENPLVTIPAGGVKTFVFAFQPTQAFGFQDIHFVWDCGNTAPAGTIPGVNTFGLLASSAATPNVLMLSATIGNTGYANIPGNTGTGFFSVAARNLGTSGPVTVSGRPLNAGTPVVVSLCETDPTSGNCLQPPAPQVAVTPWAANENRTFAFFVQGTASVADDPTTNRINATALDAQNNKVGGTGVAVRTTPP